MEYCKSKTLTVLFTAFLLVTQSALAVDKLLVYAAASTSNAVSEVIDKYNKQNSDIQVKVSFASSSTLAKQIETGAPAHIYISANPKWMDYLQERKLIINESRLNLLSNKIVLITPLGKRFDVEMSENFNLAEKLNDKLCLGDPDHVPVGIYAKQALISMTWWNTVKPSVVGTMDVQAALALVERGECAAGIVYSTDASSSNKIDLIAEFPANSHSPIVYPAATVASAPNSARNFLDYLSTHQVKEIFKKYGFNTGI